MSSLKKPPSIEKTREHASEIARVRKVIGQLEGIEKMIISERYPPQIIQQVKAATSALTALRIEVLKRHLQACLDEATLSGNHSRLLDQVLEIVHMQVGK